MGGEAITKPTIEEMLMVLKFWYEESPPCYALDYDDGVAYRVICALISQPPIPKTVTRERVDVAIQKYRALNTAMYGVERVQYLTSSIPTKSIPAFLADLGIVVEEEKL